jgi:hypothetical protein
LSPAALSPARTLRRVILALDVSQPVPSLWLPPSRTGWLAEYDGPGYYGRRVPKTPRSMAYIYGHIHCGPMLLWLAEASGVRKYQVLEAHRTMRVMVDRGLSDSSPKVGVAVRRVIPWGDVHAALIARGLLEPDA